MGMKLAPQNKEAHFVKAVRVSGSTILASALSKAPIAVHDEGNVLRHWAKAQHSAYSPPQATCNQRQPGLRRVSRVRSRTWWRQVCGVHQA